MQEDELGGRGHVSLLLVRLACVVLEPVWNAPFQMWDPISLKMEGSFTAAAHTLKFTDSHSGVYPPPIFKA